MLKILDLCSGLGGFSEAFLQAGHDVTRIENNPYFANVAETQIICIHDFATSVSAGQFDVILASPPCKEFSTAYSSPRSVASRANPKLQYQPDMKILETVLQIVNIVMPKWYIIENVFGSAKYFEPYVGKPKQISRPFLFYGVFPHLGSLPNHIKEDDRHSPIRSNIRAKIPLSISKKILQAVTQQQTLF